MQPKVYIISGNKNSGKTTLLGNVVKLLQERELETRGFLSEMVSESDEIPEYFLTNINTGNQQLLCSRREYQGWFQAGRFYFNPVVVDMGTHILLDESPPDPDFFIIDEVGRLEAEGLIWEPVIHQLLKNETSQLIWTTREDTMAAVINHFNLLNYRIFETSESEPLDIVNIILSK
ncbi:MAG: nucleoside-triphosphatase [Bacteroidales bacterium]